MATALLCRYRPGGAEDRLAIRDVHLEYMLAHAAGVRAGGAVFEGTAVVGMYVLLHTDDPGEVDTFLLGEPYTRAGLFAGVERTQVQLFMPEPHPGLLDRLLVESRELALKLRAGRTPAEVVSSLSAAPVR
jgi:hypothetical protein